MNKKNLRIFGIICLCCAVLGGTIAFLYTSRQFPVVTDSVDFVLKSAANFRNRIFPQQVEPVVSLPALVIDEESIAQKYPVFKQKTHDSSSLLPFENTQSVAELYFRIFDDGYSIECEGQFSRYRPDYDGEQSLTENWKFSADYQIITRPGIFSDAVVFLTARPELIVLDLYTGTLQYSADCPAFPAGPASVDGNSYVFRGGDNNIYAYVFSPETATPQTNFAPIKDMSVGSRALLMPKNEAIESMLLRIQNWNPAFVLPAELPVQVLSELSALPLAQIATPLYVLCPESTGEYLLGITDAHLAPVTMDAVVALFTEAGDLIAVSLDYVADRPQLTVNLTKSLFYYVAALPLGQRPHFASETIQETKTEAAVEIQNTPPSAEVFFLTLKPLRRQD